MSENPSIWGELAGLTLTKGHGTGNDFIFLTDENAEIALTPDLVARACDRHFGIGADGFIRAARSTSSRGGQKLLEEYPDAVWFMDYRNGDGSIAEMCGNGVRAFVDYLRTEGLIELEIGQTVQIATRAGVKTVARTEEGYAVDMGPWSFIHGDAAREGGEDCLVSARGLKTPRAGLSISMGNPHTVVMLGSEGKLDGLDLRRLTRHLPTARTSNSWFRLTWKTTVAPTWALSGCACTNAVWARPSPAVPAPVRRLQRPVSGAARKLRTNGSCTCPAVPWPSPSCSARTTSSTWCWPARRRWFRPWCCARGTS